MRLRHRAITVILPLALFAGGTLVAWRLHDYRKPVPKGQPLIRAVKRRDLAECRHELK